MMSSDAMPVEVYDTSPMHPKGFHHVAIQVHDVEQVSNFYSDVLGLAEIARHTREDGTLRSVWVSASGDIDAAGGFLAIEELRPGTRGDLGPSMVALRIDRDQRSKVIAELQSKGVTIEKQSRWTVYLRDPEGNLVGLSHHPHDP